MDCLRSALPFVNKTCGARHLAAERGALRRGRDPPSPSAELPPHDSLSLPLTAPAVLIVLPAFVCQLRPVHSHLWVTETRARQLLFACVCVCVGVRLCFQRLMSARGGKNTNE